MHTSQAVEHAILGARGPVARGRVANGGRLVVGGRLGRLQRE